MKRWFNLVIALMLSAGAAQAAVTNVPLGEAVEIDLRRPAGSDILQVGGFFEAPERSFRHRRCVITLNGHLLDAHQLLSPREFMQPRHPGFKPQSRIDEATGGVRFPFTHRAGGLSDFTWADGREYDKWVSLYNDFPQTVYFDVRDALRPGDTGVTVRIFNNLEEEVWIADRAVHPPFVVTELAMLAERPETDDFGPYVVPVWDFLDRHAWAREMAVGKLRDAATDAGIRAQILAQFGLLNLMTGQERAAIDLFRRAFETSSDFPEYEEVGYRLLRLTGTPPVAELPDRDTFSGRWGRLYNAYRAAVAGQPVKGLVDVPFDDSVIAADGQPAEPLWTSPGTLWHPLPYQAKGPAPEPGMAPNEFAMVYDEQFLKLLFRGPGGPSPRMRDVPGQDRPAWEFDCVELFLCPEAVFTRYYELNVTAANGRYDNRLLWSGVADAAEFRGTWRTGAALSPAGMVVEYLVPWSDLGLAAAPEPGALWIGNVIRVQHTPDAEGKPVPREFSAGDLLWRHFHRLQDGVFLRFGPR